MFEVLQHTADVRINVAAASVEELFADALLGLMEVMGGAGRGLDGAADSLALESVDRTALLVDFLNEALLRCQIRKQRYTAASFASLTETSLAATLTAVPVVRFHEDVKAVTYHEADVRRDDRGVWRTVLVLDI